MFTICSVLDRSLEGLSGPLRLHLDPVLAAQSDMPTAYRVANMIQFYLHMIDKSVHGDFASKMSARDLARERQSASARRTSVSSDGTPSSFVISSSRSPLLDYLEEMAQNAFRVFYDLLHQHARDLLDKSLVETPSAALRLSARSAHALAQVHELLEGCESSMVLPLSPKSPGSGLTEEATLAGGNDRPSGHFPFDHRRHSVLTQAVSREQGFAVILQAIIDPLLELVAMEAERLSSLLDRAIYRVNAIDSVLVTLQRFSSVTGNRMDAVQTRLSEAIDDVALHVVWWFFGDGVPNLRTSP